jgi:transcription initiation factor TFIID subunit 12
MSSTGVTTALLSMPPQTTVNSNLNTTQSSLMSSLSQNILTQSLTQTLSQSPNALQSTLGQPIAQSGPQSQSTTSSANSSLSQTPIKNPVVILDKSRLQELVQEVDPNEQLEEDVEEMLLLIADDFIESLVSTSALIAKHRKSSTLDVKDVQLALEKNWNMWVPGFGSDDFRPNKKSFSTEAHKQRMALIRKTLKKF